MKKIKISKNGVFVAEMFSDDVENDEAIKNIKDTSYPTPEYEYEVVDYIKPELTIEEQRKAKYLEKGITVEAMIIALWEKQVENRPEAVDVLQAERVKIKLEFPKE